MLLTDAQAVLFNTLAGITGTQQLTTTTVTVSRATSYNPLTGSNRTISESSQTYTVVAYANNEMATIDNVFDEQEFLVNLRSPGSSTLLPTPRIRDHATLAGTAYTVAEVETYPGSAIARIKLKDKI